jgi:hypothetical protein
MHPLFFQEPTRLRHGFDRASACHNELCLTLSSMIPNSNETRNSKNTASTGIGTMDRRANPNPSTRGDNQVGKGRQQGRTDIGIEGQRQISSPPDEDDGKVPYPIHQQVRQHDRLAPFGDERIFQAKNGEETDTKKRSAAPRKIDQETQNSFPLKVHVQHALHGLFLDICLALTLLFHVRLADEHS